MKKLLFWQLALPLLLLALICLWLAHSLNLGKAIDYSSIFLNLATDFIMVIITVWYVDRILKNYENQKWKDADYLIKYKIYDLANLTIETICTPLGVNDTNSPEYKMFVDKLNSQKNGKGTFFDYYGDFAEKFLAGIIVNQPEYNESTKEFSEGLVKKATITSEVCRNIYRQLQRCDNEANQIIDFYGSRINAEQLKALMNFESVQKDGLKLRNEKMSILPRDYPPEQSRHHESWLAKVSVHAL